MKKLTVLALALVSTLANAEIVKIADATLSHSGSTSTFTRFFMDQNSGEGYAKIATTYYPASSDDVPTVIFSKTVKIENLMLMGDQVVYRGTEGDVNCGTLGVSRIFKKPTINLTGNCSFESKTAGNKLEVFFVTK